MRWHSNLRTAPRRTGTAEQTRRRLAQRKHYTCTFRHMACPSVGPSDGHTHMAPVVSAASHGRKAPFLPLIKLQNAEHGTQSAAWKILGCLECIALSHYWIKKRIKYALTALFSFGFWLVFFCDFTKQRISFKNQLKAAVYFVIRLNIYFVLDKTGIGLEEKIEFFLVLSVRTPRFGQRRPPPRQNSPA